MVLVQKKEDQKLLEGYRLISLLLIFAKIVGRIIRKSLFNLFLRNKISNPFHSGFIPGYLYIEQHLSIIHEIKNAFDSNPVVDVRGVFLAFSKTFHKVWHDFLLFKLKSNGIEGELFSLTNSYLKIRREQRVALNGQTSN